MKDNLIGNQRLSHQSFRLMTPQHETAHADLASCGYSPSLRKLQSKYVGRMLVYHFLEAANVHKSPIGANDLKDWSSVYL